MKAELADKISIKLKFGAKTMVEIGYLGMPVIRHNNQFCRIMTMMYGIYLTQSANTLFLNTTYVITGTIAVSSRHRRGFNSR